MQDNAQLEQLMMLLGLAAPKPVVGSSAYYGGSMRMPYQADPRFMPSQQTAGMPMPPQDPGMMDPLGMQQADPAQMVQMLGGMGLG